MASLDDSERKCFTLIWKLENASFCWQSHAEPIESASFTVDEINETSWKLRLFPSIERYDEMGFYLRRLVDKSCAVIVEIEFDLAFLSSDGKVLHSIEKKNSAFLTNSTHGSYNFASRNEVFRVKKSVYLPQDILTARCRIWKNSDDLSKDVQCFARTRISVEKRSFLWCIKKFRTLGSLKKKTYEIKSLDNDKKVMSLELFITGGLFSDETIRFRVVPDYQNIKISTFQLSIVDASENATKCFQDDFIYLDPCGSKDFTLFLTKSELLERKTLYLPNDVLSLSCECAYAFGTVQEEIEIIDSDCIAVVKKKSDGLRIDIVNGFSVSKCILLDNLKSMFNSSCASDVKLRTKTQTYPSHQLILGARSPVFQAMFSNDMKENFSDCVDIGDLNDNTVLRMLQYIYTAEVEELDFGSATELYEAADMYQIPSLKDICSFYLKNNLRPNNACETLVLADLHQDEDLKHFAQDFILGYGMVIINSEEWEQLMEDNPKLAAQTMRRKFKEGMEQI